MKLDIFESQDGDCLLLESKDGRKILCDGGRTASMCSHVRDVLTRLRKAKKKIDVVYVSHVDNDHITGVLQLLQDELAWRIHDHRVKTGLTRKPPTVPRPPEIGTIWHNAFKDQVLKRDAEPIESLLAAAVPAFNGTGVKHLEQAAGQLGELATAVKEAVKVSHLVSPHLLDIPVNKLPNVGGKAKLLMLRPKQKAFKLGSLKLTIVGPGTKELDDLRTGWNNWLNANKETVSSVRAQMKKRIDELSAGTLSGQPFDLSDWNGIPPFKKVTTPNIASLMFMVEEDGKRILLTGDAQQDFITDGLRKTGFLPKSGGGLHLDVLKVQHHGSENNIDDKFCRLVSADHYVFCGNGSHKNPELKVIDMIFESRLGAQSKRSLAPQAVNRPFTFWFSTTSKAQKTGSKERNEFAKVEARVKTLQKASKGRLKARYNKGAFITLSI